MSRSRGKRVVPGVDGLERREMLSAMPSAHNAAEVSEARFRPRGPHQPPQSHAEFTFEFGPAHFQFRHEFLVGYSFNARTDDYGHAEIDAYEKAHFTPIPFNWTYNVESLHISLAKGDFNLRATTSPEYHDFDKNTVVVTGVWGGGATGAFAAIKINSMNFRLEMTPGDEWFSLSVTMDYTAPAARPRPPLVHRPLILAHPFRPAH